MITTYLQGLCQQAHPRCYFSLAICVVADQLFVTCASVVFRNNSFLAERAYEVKGCPERYDVLEKEQSQKAHIPHVAYALNGNDRPRGRYDHSAGGKEHGRRDKSS